MHGQNHIKYILSFKVSFLILRLINGSLLLKAGWVLSYLACLYHRRI